MNNYATKGLCNYSLELHILMLFNLHQIPPKYRRKSFFFFFIFFFMLHVLHLERPWYTAPLSILTISFTGGAHSLSPFL